MGKLKRGHNWKARQQKETTVDTSDQKKLENIVQVKGVHKDEYDDDNLLVLPSKKRKTKVKGDDAEEVRRLTKKQRKKLEKIVERKDKKEKRVALLEALQKVQPSAEEMSMLTSTTELHSQKFKKEVEIKEIKSDGVIKINALKKTKAQKAAERATMEVEEESSSSSSSEESEEEDEEEEEAMEENMEESEQQTETKQEASEVKDTTNKEEKDNVKPKKETVPSKPATHIPIKRDPDIQEQRLKLPIIGEEQLIMEAINENNVTILCGETGSGKTTQVPQFLYEAGYAHGGSIIGVTEPRRVAAISMSRRVGAEMCLSAKQVSYQIRYEGNVSPETKIKFMTDGVLLKEVQKDFLLRKYSVIIIDEAHERSVYTDILIGLLSRIVPLRQKRGMPMKLIIMSATLRVEDFTQNSRLFPVTPPAIKVESRQFPVSIHFNKKTPDDYLGEAFKKVCKIHRQLPEGGILVFVTSQQEVHTLCAKMRKMFPPISKDASSSSSSDPSTKGKLPKISLDSYSALPEDEEEAEGDRWDTEHIDDEDDGGGGGIDEDEEEDEEVKAPMKLGRKVTEQPVYVLPLYSLLASDKQAKVFDPPPEGSRLCIVATNVAETSLTIPNIKYVVDTGKSMDIDKVGNFPFPTPPDAQALNTAESLLTSLGALEKVTNKKKTGALVQSSLITALGRTMACFPVAPRYGKMLSLAHQHDLLPYVISIVSALSVQELFAEERGEKMADEMDEEEKQRRQRIQQVRKTWAGTGNSFLLGDLMVLLKAVGAAEYSGNLTAFCQQQGIRYKAMMEIRKLRAQLTNAVNSVISEANVSLDPRMSPPSDLQARLIRQIVLAGHADHVAKKIEGATDKKLKFAYISTSSTEPVFIHPSSSLWKANSPYIVYQNIEETSKLFMKGITAIDPSWLPVFAGTQCRFSKPQETPEPSYHDGQVYCHMSASFGPHSWAIESSELVHPLNIDKYRWFARFLLEGQVFPRLEKFSKVLLLSPATMVKSWAKLQQKTESLLQSLVSVEAHSKATLLKVWKKNPQAVLKAYLEWVPESIHVEVQSAWPPIQEQDE